MINSVILTIQVDSTKTVNLYDLQDSEQLLVKPVEDTLAVIDVTQDTITQLSIVEDEPFSLDIDQNLDNFYLKVYVEEQSVDTEPLVIYRDMWAANLDQAELDSYYMSHAGRFRVVKSGRTWFTSNLRNKYSVAGRLF